jgi:L-ascorbate metabolism protein UlaG (beta-lactamase superfamily)
MINMLYKLVGLAFVVLSTSALSTDTMKNPSNHFDGKHFFNQPAEPAMASPWKIWWYFFTAPRVDTAPTQPLPVQTLDWMTWQALPPDKVHVVRLGHSSMLMKLHGQQWLLDPVFSERASPLSFAGPKRFHPVPIDVDSMPMMDGLLLSHDHYDHLDASTIERIHPKVKQFVTALGVGKRLQGFGVPAEKIIELDWHQSVEVAGVRFTAEPAQHFSGRGLLDRNTTLWASWVIESPSPPQAVKLYFSADTGYFEGFKKIGAQHGPFDLVLMEAGAWDRNWAGIHMTPEQSVQAHLDVQGQVMMPVHNSTFELALHPWYEPLERVSALSQERGVVLATPMMGEVYTVGTMPAVNPWWRPHMP